MSRRAPASLILISLVSAASLLAGCSGEVRVETGERIVCAYGEVTTDTIHTVEVPAVDAAKYKVVRETVICSRHQQLETLYTAAQDAIDAGDLTEARAKLVEVIKIEPLFKNAQQQIDRIDEGKKPVVDRSTSTPTADPNSAYKPGKTSAPTDMIAPPAKQPVGPVASLSAWIPDALPGYAAMPIVSGTYTLTRQYKPAAGAPTDALVVVVEQYKDAASAQKAIKNDFGSTYGTGAQTLTVNGRSVWFGTDGKRLAVAAWNEGGILVVVEGSSKEGKPTALKSHLTSLVTAITD